MSTLHHESILESIFEDVLSEYYHQLNAGDITQTELETIAQQRFNDLLQWNTSFPLISKILLLIASTDVYLNADNLDESDQLNHLNSSPLLNN